MRKKNNLLQNLHGTFF